LVLSLITPTKITIHKAVKMEAVTKFLNNVQLPAQLESLLKDDSQKKIVVYGAAGRNFKL